MAEKEKQTAEVQDTHTEVQENGMYLTMEGLKDLMKTMIQEMKKEPMRVGDVNKIHTRIKAEQDMVKVKLFRDNGKYKDDVVVSLNGKRYLVPRGVEVEVPRGVKEILDNSMSQDEATEMYVRQKAEEWDRKVKEL